MLLIVVVVGGVTPLPSSPSEDAVKMLQLVVLLVGGEDGIQGVG